MTETIVNTQLKDLWTIFNKMQYGDSIVLGHKLPDCGCTTIDCFDYGTRKTYEVIKTKMVDVDPYYCEKIEDVVMQEEKPGLEFHEIFESWSESEQKWDVNLFGRDMFFRLNFNEIENKITMNDDDSVKSVVWLEKLLALK